MLSLVTKKRGLMSTFEWIFDYLFQELLSLAVFNTTVITTIDVNEVKLKKHKKNLIY